LPHSLKFKVLPQTLAVCQLPRDAEIPNWAIEGEFFSITRTGDEVSIVCEEGRVPSEVKVERNFVALKLEGPFPFSMTGVLASFIEPLARHKVPVFAVATFDTDYVLINREDLDAAVEVLKGAGHQFLK